MKVLQITPTLCMGGAETMCENLTNALIKSGVDVTVVSLYSKKTPISERLEDQGVKIIYLGKRNGLDLSMVGKLKKVFKEEKSDVIHTHNNTMQYAIPAAILSGVKRRVHTVHSIAQKELGKFARKAASIFYRRHNLTPVALSETVKKTVQEVYQLPAEKIPVVFNGVDLNKCVVKTDYSSGDIFTIVHVGRFANEKNHIMLVKAFCAFHKQVKNSRLVLLGDGENRTKIENCIKENLLEDCVELAGIQPYVYGYLGAADIFTLPSHYEGIPLSLIEAMGTALPIVATRVGGIPDMVKDGESAILVDVDENQLCDGFLRLYYDEALRKYIGENALKASKKFSSQEMARKYIEIYES